MVWLLLSPNPASPIWWMGTLYSIELVLLIGKLVLDLRGMHGRYDRPLAWGTLVVATAAAITIGAVFGTVGGRPDYHGAHLSIVTLTSAVVGGTAAIVLLRPEGPLTALAGRALRAAAIAFSALILFRLLAEARITEAGHLGWAKVWMLIPFIAIGYALDRAPRLLAAGGLLGTFAVHYSFIVTGQLVALGPPTGTRTCSRTPPTCPNC